MFIFVVDKEKDTKRILYKPKDYLYQCLAYFSHLTLNPFRLARIKLVSRKHIFAFTLNPVRAFKESYYRKQRLLVQDKKKSIQLMYG